MTTATGAPPRAPGAGIVIQAVRPPPGLVRRAMTVNRHLIGLLAGGLVAAARRPPDETTKKPDRRWLLKSLAFFVRPFVRRDLVGQPFAVQLRRRLELLGPTYIKLGQILSLREDLLPRAVTDELKNLLDGLPAVPFADFRRIVERDLGRPLDALFLSVDEEPLGSGSIAQIHRATTRVGDPVVLKAVKPGIPEILRRDARLLKVLGGALQLVFPRYQPQRIIREFVDYTAREVDLRREADNALTFAANFTDLPDVQFPQVYYEFSGPNVLCMEYLDGLRPDTAAAHALPEEERERLVDLGAAAIIRMIYRDGFFHADLHPGNLLILPETKVGFIDLGMVGRLDSELRRTLLYYYYSLVTGDAENAARYLSAVAQPGTRPDIAGFRREVVEISLRWQRAATFEGFSLAQLILESLGRGARYGVYFPVELVLMVKALITFEGVGHVLLPGFNVAEVSRRHIRAIFVNQFSPLRLLQEELRAAPDLVDAMAKIPLLITEGVQVLARSTRHPAENPFAGIRGTLIAGFCLVAAAILMAFGSPWPLWAGLFAAALFLAVRRGG
ncbi:MAG TPA: AarF/UbiB family protein [Gemmatimonadales bacterium]|nr:AarF/UbiB family protein [Gemmatimonadales bacterium]